MSTVIIHYRRFTPIIEAFERLGYEVCDLGEARARSSLDDVALFLVCMYDEIKTPVSSLAFKARLKRAGIPVIAWNRDGPANKGEKAWRLWLLRHLPYFDVYASHTMQGAETFSAHPLYLPNAAWVRHYNLAGRTLAELRDQAGYEFDISFFGRVDPRRYPEMEERHQFLEALKPRLDALGIRYLFTDAALDFAEQRDLIQRSRINLNFHAGCDSCYHGETQAPERSWGLPERCYGIPACGGFLLSDRREHASDDFRPDTEWIAFDGLEDCLSRIRFHLDCFDHTRTVAEAQHRRIMADHTYERRAHQLLEAAQVWREKHR